MKRAEKRTQLELIGLYKSYPQKESCAIILKEIGGERKLILNVSLYEAESILVIMEDIRLERPLMHDLFVDLLNLLRSRVEEVTLDDFNRGIFHSSLVVRAQEEEFRLTARSCDAVALAIRFSSPIYAYESVLEKASILEKRDPDDLPSQDISSSTGEKELSHLRDEELKAMLRIAVDEEAYELASRIRNELLVRLKPEKT
ncbi:MAG: bifunctional nuclease family protein [Chitinophagales bacterium]|nr:bifunctional nuclease family protein [Chitinophagales bacterium]